MRLGLVFAGSFNQAWSFPFRIWLGCFGLRYAVSPRSRDSA